MKSHVTVRRAAVGVGAAALLSMGMLGACATKEKPAESTPPPSPTASAPPSPSEKGAPNSGSEPRNSYGPSVKARPAPTALPGNVNTG